MKLIKQELCWKGRNVKLVKNRLKELREKYDFTQEELAEQADVSRQTIISLEKGKYDPSIQLAFKLSKILKTGIEDIFLYEGEHREKSE